MNNKAKKSILPIVIGMVAIVAVVGVVWMIMSRGNNDSGSSDSTSTNSTGVDDATKVTADELAADKVSETVGFGDYTAMFTLSKAIQNGQKSGAIVEV